MSSTSSTGCEKPEPMVFNALLRCSRKDDKAAPLFEPIEKVPGLWVLELGPFEKESWSAWLAELHETLSSNQAILAALKQGSSDYTLHIAVGFSEGHPAIIPPSLSQILATCGITVELYLRLP
jgi:hypothetical protein